MIHLPAVQSPASQAAAVAVKPSTTLHRRQAVLYSLQSVCPQVLARFQVADMLGVPEHWISSSIAALKKSGEIEELDDQQVLNPASGKWCNALRARHSATHLGNL